MSNDDIGYMAEVFKLIPATDKQPNEIYVGWPMESIDNIAKQCNCSKEVASVIYWQFHNAALPLINILRGDPTISTIEFEKVRLSEFGDLPPPTMYVENQPYWNLHAIADGYGLSKKDADDVLNAMLEDEDDDRE